MDDQQLTVGRSICRLFLPFWAACLNSGILIDDHVEENGMLPKVVRRWAAMFACAAIVCVATIYTNYVNSTHILDVRVLNPYGVPGQQRPVQVFDVQAGDRQYAHDIANQLRSNHLRDGPSNAFAIVGDIRLHRSAVVEFTGDHAISRVKHGMKLVILIGKGYAWVEIIDFPNQHALEFTDKNMISF